MQLTPREKDKLLVSLAAMVARNRLQRGLGLDALPGHAQPSGLRQSDEGPQLAGTASAGNNSDAGLRQSKGCALIDGDTVDPRPKGRLRSVCPGANIACIPPGAWVCLYSLPNGITLLRAGKKKWTHGREQHEPSHRL